MIGPNDAAISIRNVGKVFSPSPRWLRFLIKSPLKAPIKALDSVSLEVTRGEICALVGPNGAGKTTLFRILVGLTTPSVGNATVMGRDVVTDSLAIRRQVGWMPTSNETLFERHTVMDNLRFQGRVYGLSGRDLDSAARATLEMVGLYDVGSNAVVSLSTGMRARLRLARALLHRPRVLILDEPTSSVDPVASLALIRLILGVVEDRGISAIISSHRLDEIEALESHVVLLNRGSVLFDGALPELRLGFENPVFRLVFDSAEHGIAARAILEESMAADVLPSEDGSLTISLTNDGQLGSVLTSLGADLNHAVSVQRVDTPLREILARVYQEDDVKGGDA